MDLTDRVSLFKCNYYCIGTYLYERIGNKIIEYIISGVTIDYSITRNSYRTRNGYRTTRDNERLYITYYLRDTIGQDAGKISHNEIESRFILSDVRLRLPIDEDD